MSSSPLVRAAEMTDVAAVREIAIGTALFDAESWPDVESVMLNSLNGQLEDHTWIVRESDAGEVVGAAYYAPEPFSYRMWNLYFLGVRPGQQGSGTGAALVAHVEAALRDRSERVLIIETSGVDGFEATREFYRKQGYVQEARIREFYGTGDDKVVFWKALYSPS
jgi:ribosomal protein S18 acetylase RimI-like enzyme